MRSGDRANFFRGFFSLCPTLRLHWLSREWTAEWSVTVVCLLAVLCLAAWLWLHCRPAVSFAHQALRHSVAAASAPPADAQTADDAAAAMSSFNVGVDNDFPDQVYASLQRSNHSKQISAQLNTAATLLAVGCSDGIIAMSVKKTQRQRRRQHTHRASGSGVERL